MKKVRLVEVVNDFNKIRVPLSSNQRKLLKKIYPYYGAQGIVDYVEDFLFDGEYLLIAEDGENLKSNNQNICNIVKGKFWVNNHAHILQGKKDNLTRYLYYKLNTINFSPFVTGSSQPKLNKENLFSIEFFIHENIKIQQKIAKILSDIDDKIEILHQINDNLAELTKTIYDYWFVQFDFPDENGKPYKTSGGKMVYNEVLKKEIPEGWEVKKLGEILTIASGFPFDSNDYNEYGNYQIITIKNVQENYLSLSKADRISFIPSKMKSFCFLEIGDILISLTGNVGRLCFVNKQNLLLNQRVGKFLCDEKYKNYIYCLFNSNETKVRLEKIATGSSQKNLSPIDAVDSFSFMPKENILKKFNKKTNPIYKKNIENLQQIQHLQSLRDWLLPMLMNGQISVE